MYSYMQKKNEDKMQLCLTPLSATKEKDLESLILTFTTVFSDYTKIK